MKTSVRHIWLEKGGNTPEQYEDAACVDFDAGRVAVADGASDSYDAGRWAELLVRTFIAQPPSFNVDALAHWFERLGREWRSTGQFKDLPWYKEEKARQGAFSTFLGIQFSEPLTSASVLGKPWIAVGLGDTCLFQLRGERLIETWPIAEANDFDTSPPLVATNNGYNRSSLRHLGITHGEGVNGDTFLLATDALAHWFLASYQRGEKPWSRLIGMVDAEIIEFFTQLRRSHYMRNDDITLVVITVGEQEAHTANQLTRLTTHPPVPLASSASDQDQVSRSEHECTDMYPSLVRS